MSQAAAFGSGPAAGDLDAVRTDYCNLLAVEGREKKVEAKLCICKLQQTWSPVRGILTSSVIGANGKFWINLRQLTKAGFQPFPIRRSHLKHFSEKDPLIAVVALYTVRMTATTLDTRPL